MKDTAKLRLVIDVTYQLNGVGIEELERRLHFIATYAASNGLFTGESPAEVKTWGWKVLRPTAKKKVPNGKRKNPTR